MKKLFLILHVFGAKQAPCLVNGIGTFPENQLSAPRAAIRSFIFTALSSEEPEHPLPPGYQEPFPTANSTWLCWAASSPYKSKTPFKNSMVAVRT